MLGCANCKQFGFVHLPFNNKSFRRMLDRHLGNGRLEQNFHRILLEWVYPRSKIQVCDCCGDGDDGWWFEPGIHYLKGDCRPGESTSPIEEILIRHQINPIYWEYFKTGNERYFFGIFHDDSPYYGPGGNTWERALKEAEKLKLQIA